MKSFGILAVGCLAASLATYTTDAAAQTRAWGTFFGGMKEEIGHKVAVDAAGNVYVVGKTHSGDGIATPDGFDPFFNNPAEGYLAKFDSDGALIWSTYYGDGPGTELVDVGLDQNGNVYVVGTTKCPSEGLANTFDKSCDGPSDMVLAKFSPGGALQWNTYFGGDSTDGATAISVTPAGNVYLIGSTISSMGLVPPSSVDATHGGGWDGVVAKFGTQGNLLWARYYGGESIDLATDIACRPAMAEDICFITGQTSSTGGIATKNGHDIDFGGEFDAFLARISGTIGKTVWGSYYGGSDMEDQTSVAIDQNFDAVLGGVTLSDAFAATPDAEDVDLNGGADLFLARFDAGGSRKTGRYLGTIHVEQTLLDVGLDAESNVYVFSEANSANWTGMVTPGAYDTLYGGGQNDLVLTKLDADLHKLWGTLYGGNGAELGTSDFGSARPGGGIALDAQNHIYVTGPSNSTDEALSSPGSHKPMSQEIDAFVAEFVQ
ncbi:SBBP repeat-containing protein [Luteimonas sp. SX5]|uniref:SBBP repeat-containing protein n=1 Tax=Luteimonas galliterrae TaxID=2940486 RepID=A0ABT0ML65_9GAMM|nr:SBBP repeat-containing protein [Luteimonas galliterrae]MCL1635616.1 SBBP repeat-containing protein [Luteimonas galliterrae]